MSNGDDTADACCAIGLCCGGDDDQKQKAALVKILRAALQDQPHTLENVADALIEHFDLTPKSWGWGVLMRHIGVVARKNPYV